MCLFLQNTNFQRQTVALLSDMHAGSRLANATIAAVNAGLMEQHTELEAQRQQLTGLQHAQALVLSEVERQAAGVQQLAVQQEQLEGQMNVSISLQVSQPATSLLCCTYPAGTHALT
jgi:hypothetical protein